jgi:hypothetical protein
MCNRVGEKGTRFENQNETMSIAYKVGIRFRRKLERCSRLFWLADRGKSDNQPNCPVSGNLRYHRVYRTNEQPRIDLL